MKIFSLVRTVILGWITINGILVPITFGEEAVAFGAIDSLLARGDRERNSCAAFEKRFRFAAEGDNSGQTEVGTWPVHQSKASALAVLAALERKPPVLPSLTKVNERECGLQEMHRHLPRLLRDIKAWNFSEAEAVRVRSLVAAFTSGLPPSASILSAGIRGNVLQQFFQLGYEGEDRSQRIEKAEKFQDKVEATRVKLYGRLKPGTNPVFTLKDRLKEEREVRTLARDYGTMVNGVHF